jgi:hypothetical protein
MGRISWFVAGGLFGGLQILNQVYETEVLKEEIGNEIRTAERIQNFVSPY